ncbi:MAG: hypothetical protein ACE5JL_02435 [Dehalococcoidia bacterium]
MEIDDERIAHAVSNTEVLKAPRQTLATFGTTNIRYFLLTRPAYDELVKGAEETVVREGRVIAERPKVVTPSYMLNLVGFGENAHRFFQQLILNEGPNTPGILYHYRNEPKELNIVSGNIMSVLGRIEKEIEGEPLAAIIRGIDEMWDVSLLKFIHDLTARSVEGNLMELGSQGLMSVDSSGVPGDARRRIEELFQEVRMNREDSTNLKKELDRWGLFQEYEDRFLHLFR